jgi:hypothetical protein
VLARKVTSVDLAVRDIELGVIQIAGGWAGVCRACGLRRWVDGGYALFWTKTGEPKGWAGWGGPHGTDCPRACTNLFGAPHASMSPLPFADQEAYLAVYRIGGWDAVVAAIPVWPRVPR